MRDDFVVYGVAAAKLQIEMKASRETSVFDAYLCIYLGTQYGHVIG